MVVVSKTKPKVITTANQTKGTCFMEPLTTQSKHTITDYKRDKTRITRFLLVLVGMQTRTIHRAIPIKLQS